MPIPRRQAVQFYDPSSEMGESYQNTKFNLLTQDLELVEFYVRQGQQELDKRFFPTHSEQ